MKICVVGAGVVGITTAHSLAKRGHEVTVIDARGQAGQEASYANGAQLSYSYVAPLAHPSVWGSLTKYLFDRDSPLTFKPKPDPAQWLWIAHFLMACNARSSRHATAELLRLAFFSKQTLEALQADLQLDFDFRTGGKLVLFDNATEMEAARRQVDLQSKMGCVQEILSAPQCVALEPTLAASTRIWAGGVYTQSEQVGDCAKFCSQLANAITHRYPSVRFAFDTLVTGVSLSNGRLAALQSSRGNIEADAFVFANGVGSVKLASNAGFSLPIYPLKGYSITINPVDANNIPSVSITDYSKKIVYARIGNRLRVAGRIEIVGDDRAIDQRRCRELADEAQHFLPGLATRETDISPWAGLRPATPTGIPVISRAPLGNVYINSGHGALGWTLACGSAELLANQIDGEPCAIDATAFNYKAY